MFSNSKIIVTLLVSVLIISCSVDEEYQSNNVLNTKIQTEQNDYSFIQREYPQYETNNYTDEEIVAILTSFSELINNNNIPDYSYNINCALFAMETFFNAAIVDKQTKFDTCSYNAQSFSFSIDRNSNGEIDPALLRDKYILFIKTILYQMDNKFLQFSDVYVREITSSTITFGLDMPYFKSEFYDSFEEMIQIRRQRVRNINEKYPTNHLLSGNTSDWNGYSQEQVDEQMRIHSKINASEFFWYNVQFFSPPIVLGGINEVWPIFKFCNEEAIDCWEWHGYNYQKLNYNGSTHIINTLISAIENQYNISTGDIICIDVYPAYYPHAIDDPYSICNKKRYAYGVAKHIILAKLGSKFINNFMATVNLDIILTE